MPYTNEKADLALAGIIHYINDDISEMRLRQRLKCLDYEAVCSINSNDNSLLHDVLHLAYNNPSKCVSIIDALQVQVRTIDLARKKAPQSLSASSFLITHKNFHGLSPFYTALDIKTSENVIQRCSDWLSTSIHEFARGGQPIELQLCFEELNNALKHKAINQTLFRKIVFPNQPENRNFVDIALTSGCPNTIRVALNNVQVSIPKLKEVSYAMLNNSKANKLIILLKTFIQAHINNELVDSLSPFIADIFLNPNNQGYRLLDRAFLPPNSSATLQHILAVAKEAHDLGILSRKQYCEMLITHHHKSPLHEAMLTGNTNFFLAYMHTVLNEFLKRTISMSQMKNFLIAPMANRKNAAFLVMESPMHRAANSGSLEITELFVHIFNAFFSKIEYTQALSAKLSNGTIPICQPDKPEAEKINTFIALERQRLGLIMPAAYEQRFFSHLPRTLSHTYRAKIDELYKLTAPIHKIKVAIRQEQHALKTNYSHPQTGRFFRANQQQAISPSENHVPSFS